MSDEQGQDEWLNQDLPAAQEWAATLKPRTSSNWWLIAIALLAIFLIVWTIRGPVQHQGPVSRPEINDVVKERAAPPAPGSTARPPKSFDPSAQHRIDRVQRCISAAGAVTYSDAPCSRDARGVTLELKPDTNMAEGMSYEAREASNRASAAEAQNVAAHERRVARNVNQLNTECAQLDALIAAIDATARLPQPAGEQDRLRDQRKRARDRQFSLRCA